MNKNDKVMNMPGLKNIPKPIMQMKITVLDNKSVVVNGIPANLRTALGILFDANKAIVDHFVNKAKEGELDDKNTIIQNKIIAPSNKIII